LIELDKAKTLRIEKAKELKERQQHTFLTRLDIKHHSSIGGLIHQRSASMLTINEKIKRAQIKREIQASERH